MTAIALPLRRVRRRRRKPPPPGTAVLVLAAAVWTYLGWVAIQKFRPVSELFTFAVAGLLWRQAWDYSRWRVLAVHRRQPLVWAMGLGAIATVSVGL